MVKCICDLKDDEQKMIVQGDYNNLFITREFGEYWIKALSDGYAAMPIKYCPECGRLLEEIDEDEY